MKYLHARKDLSNTDLAEIYCKLNSWEWDERLGEKPKGFDTMEMDEKHKIVWPLILQIRMVVSEYTLNKEWQKRHRGAIQQGEQTFDEWFSINKVEPALNEWKALNKGRKIRRKDTQKPDRNVLYESQQERKHPFARFFATLSKRFQAK